MTNNEKNIMNDLARPNLHQLGNDRKHGNLLGIEPYMIPQDYASKESFFDKLNAYLLAAQRAQWLNAKTIVIFPEYIGAWLAIANESEKILQTKTLAKVERAMVLQHPLKFAAHFIKAKENGKAEAAFFRMKANQMAEIYQDVFSQLARTYAVTLLAGSIILPALHLSNRRLILHNGPLHNLSLLYQPDGAPHPHLICKAFPTSREQPFTASASANDIPSFETPAGRLGALICADSWYPQAYARLKQQNIDLLAVPSYEASGMQRWHQPWLGYNGWHAPADVDTNDIHNLTETQAWKKYSLAGRIQSSGARYGMNVFLRGKLWDQDLGGGPATMIRNAELFMEEPTEQAAILNLWL